MWVVSGGGERGDCRCKGFGVLSYLFWLVQLNFFFLRIFPFSFILSSQCAIQDKVVWVGARLFTIYKGWTVGSEWENETENVPDGEMNTFLFIHRMNVGDKVHLRPERRLVSLWCAVIWTGRGIEFHPFILVVCCRCLLLQVTMEFGLDKRHHNMQGLVFPLQEDANIALEQLQQRRINYIQLVQFLGGWGKQIQKFNTRKQTQPAQCHLCLFVCVCVSQRLDIQKETIELVHTKPTEIHDLPLRIPTDTPRYPFFMSTHSHTGQQQEALGQ